MRKERAAGLRRRFTEFWDKRGFGVVLCLCFAIIGFTALWTRRPSAETEPEPPQVTTYATPAPTPVAALSQGVVLETPASIELHLPVEGARLGETCSGDGLAYDEALGEWRQHAGVDYLGDAETPVRAVFAGSVERIWQDDRWGQCLTLLSTEGERCLYACLSDELLVEEGAAVATGQSLGFLGESPLLERDAGFHVHVELYAASGRCLSDRLPLP